MGLRDGNTITLTIACAIVDKYCADIREYQEYMGILTEEIGNANDASVYDLLMPQSQFDFEVELHRICREARSQRNSSLRSSPSWTAARLRL